MQEGERKIERVEDESQESFWPVMLTFLKRNFDKILVKFNQVFQVLTYLAAAIRTV